MTGAALAPLRRVKVDAYACTCQRCGHQWTTTAEAPPTRCAGCKAALWDRAPRWSRGDARRAR